MKRKIFWGLLFLALGALLLINWFTGGVPIVRLMLGVICLYAAMRAAIKGDIELIFFPLAFIYLLFRPEISEYVSWKAGQVSPWLVLLCALLFTIGTAILMPKKQKLTKTVNGEGKTEYEFSYHTDGEANKLGAGVKYVDCADFTYAKAQNKLGQLDVYFSNVELYHGGGTLEVENELGQLSVYVPAGWRIVNKVKAGLGVVVCTDNDGIADDAPVLTVIGSSNLGEVEIERK